MFPEPSTIIYEGRYAEAKVFAPFVEKSAEDQIKDLLDIPGVSGSQIRIMPDVHAGAGCVIGFTARLTSSGPFIPNLVGVDIGCGVLGVIRDGLADDLSKIDERIQSNVPSGKSVRSRVFPGLDGSESYAYLCEELKRVCMDVLKEEPDRHLLSIGSLGGGNHFIEVNRDASGDPLSDMLTVHSGSRNFGLKVANHYQRLAVVDPQCENYPKSLAFLMGDDVADYLRDMRVAQRMAALNRRIILASILDVSLEELEEMPMIDTVHNYISDDFYLRKGAVSAQEGELFILPINMAHGSYVMKGKGNPDYNYSAPHGAGRIMGRMEAKRRLDMNDFRDVMQKAGVQSSCISENTLDEAPMAYKDPSAIMQEIGGTADIVRHMKAVYNFKATT